MNKNNFLNLDTVEKASEFVANQIISLVNSKPNCVLGLATGSTPLKVYEYLIEDYQKNKTNYQNVTTFNLDEYVGLDKKYADRSYRYFMNKNLFSKININLNNTYFPDEKNPEKYDALIKNKGGIDFQILGIGINGHIGFNEPPADLNSKTRIVKLTDSTIKANSRFFMHESDVPTSAVSMGLWSILQAKQIVLIAFGKSKKDAIEKLYKLNDFDSNLPASSLIKNDNVLVIVDQESSFY